MPPKKRFSTKKSKKKAGIQSRNAGTNSENTYEGRKTPPPTLAHPSDFGSTVEVLFEQIVAKLCPDFVPESLKDPVVLRQCLIEVLFGNLETANDICSFLFDSLLTGRVNRSMPFHHGEAYPLIILLSQWKQLRKTMGYCGGDDMLEIVIKMGADVNVLLASNGVNALFFAVKYATIHAVNLLVDAGINVHVKDIGGRTCLYNTLEYPNPKILSRILEFLPATETFRAESGFDTLTAADALLNFFVSESYDLVTNEKRSMPISWLILGRPSAEDMGHAFVILLRKGVTFSPKRVGILNAVFGVVTPPSDSIGYDNFVGSKKLATAVGKMLVGIWLPDAVKAEVAEYDLAKLALGKEKSEKNCAICLERKSKKERIELYCGHVFCLVCIIAHGQSNTMRGTSCPVCHKLLCLELCGDNNRHRGKTGAQLLGIRDAAGFEAFGPKALNEENAMRECLVRNIRTSGKTTDELKENLLLDRRNSHMEIELAANITVFDGTSSVLAPLHGAVVIPIVVKSIPVLAYLSTRSPFTIVTPVFAQNFGLRKKNLESGKLRVFSGEKMHTVISAVEEFEFNFGSINVTMNSVVQLASTSQSKICSASSYAKSIAVKTLVNSAYYSLINLKHKHIMTR